MVRSGETEAELHARIAMEKKVYKKYAGQDLPEQHARRGRENPVNRRKAKSCPICGSVNKQMTRHIRTQHGMTEPAPVLEFLEDFLASK